MSEDEAAKLQKVIDGFAKVEAAFARALTRGADVPPAVRDVAEGLADLTRTLREVVELAKAEA
jgi:hypothetical protein